MKGKVVFSFFVSIAVCFLQAQTQGRILLEYDSSDWNSYRDVFFEVKDVQKSENFGGENSYSTTYVGKDTLMYIEWIKNANGKKVVRNGNGYFYGSDKLTYLPHQYAFYNKWVDSSFYKSTARFINGNYDFYFSINAGQGAVFEMLKELDCFDFISNSSSFNCEAGTFRDGLKDGEWFRFQNASNLVPKKKLTFADTIQFYMQPNDTSSQTIPGFIYMNYKSGLLNGKCIRKTKGDRLEGQFENNKRVGTWIVTRDFVLEGERQGEGLKHEQMSIYYQIPFKNDTIDGEINIYETATNKHLGTVLVRKGKFVAPLYLWNRLTLMSSPMLDGNKYRKFEDELPVEYVYFKGEYNEQTGELKKTFFSPRADTISSMKGKSYPAVWNNKKEKKYQYKWDDYNRISAEEQYDSIGNGFSFYKNDRSSYYDYSKSTKVITQGKRIQTNTYYFGVLSSIKVKDDSITSHVFYSEKGDTIALRMTLDGRRTGILIETDPIGKNYFITNGNEIKYIKRFEGGIQTIKDGFGYFTTHYGERITVEDSVWKFLSLKDSLVELRAKYKDKTWKPIFATDSSGVQTLSDGTGYIDFKCSLFLPNDEFKREYYYTGKRVSYLEYQCLLKPQKLDKLIYSTTRKVTEVSPGLYKVEYSCKLPYSGYKICLADTFPLPVSIVYSNLPEKNNLKWYRNRSKVNVYYLTGTLDSELYEFTSTIWLRALPKQNFISTKGALHFYLYYGGEDLKSLPLNKPKSLRELTKRVNISPKMIENLSDFSPSDYFKPNSKIHKVKIGDFEIRRSVAATDVPNQFILSTIIENLKHTQYNQPVYYIERFGNKKDYMSTSNYEDGVLQIQIFNPNDKPFNEDCEIFDKYIYANNEDSLLMVGSINIGELKSYIGNNGQEFYSGENEYYIGTFSSNKFNRLYQKYRGLSDSAYQAVLDSFDTSQCVDANEQFTYKELGYGVCESEVMDSVRDDRSPSGVNMHSVNFKLLKQTDTININAEEDFGIQYMLVSPIKTIVPLELIWKLPRPIVNENGQTFTELKDVVWYPTNEKLHITYGPDESFRKNDKIIIEVYFNKKKIGERAFYLY